MAEKKQNSWSGLINIAFNVIIPLTIMTRLNKENLLGPVWALVVALAFPLGYGVWEYRNGKNGKDVKADAVQGKGVNVFSIVGLVSVLLTGGIALLQIPAEWIAVKEAGIPLLLGIGVLIALWRGYPVAKVFVLQALDMEKITGKLQAESNKLAELESLEKGVSYVFAGSFFISAILNYFLAVSIVTAAPGTEEFTAQIGRMTGLSFPVIAIPLTVVLMVAVGYLLWRVSKLTGLGIEDLVET